MRIDQKNIIRVISREGLALHRVTVTTFNFPSSRIDLCGFALGGVTSPMRVAREKRDNSSFRSGTRIPRSGTEAEEEKLALISKSAVCGEKKSRTPRPRLRPSLTSCGSQGRDQTSPGSGPCPREPATETFTFSGSQSRSTCQVPAFVKFISVYPFPGKVTRTVRGASVCRGNPVRGDSGERALIAHLSCLQQSNSSRWQCIIKIFFFFACGQ